MDKGKNKKEKMNCSTMLYVFPISNLIGLCKMYYAKVNGYEVDYTPSGHPLPTGPIDMLNKCLASVPMVMFAFMLDYFTPMQQYVEDAKVLDFSADGWMMKILYRDFLFGFAMIIVWSLIVDVILNKIYQPMRFNQQHPGVG